MTSELHLLALHERHAGTMLAMVYRPPRHSGLDVGGPNLAGQFVRRGLVDEWRLVIHPVVLGAGTPFWPELDGPLRLRLVETRRFTSGVEVRSYVPA